VWAAAKSLAIWIFHVAPRSPRSAP
jgi:hypothetical protein